MDSNQSKIPIAKLIPAILKKFNFAVNDFNFKLDQE
jgi:hypothetical protein